MGGVARIPLKKTKRLISDLQVDSSATWSHPQAGGAGAAGFLYNGALHARSCELKMKKGAGPLVVCLGYLLGMKYKIPSYMGIFSATMT